MDVAKIQARLHHLTNVRAASGPTQTAERENAGCSEFTGSNGLLEWRIILSSFDDIGLWVNPRMTASGRAKVCTTSLAAGQSTCIGSLPLDSPMHMKSGVLGKGMYPRTVPRASPRRCGAGCSLSADRDPLLLPRPTERASRQVSGTSAVVFFPSLRGDGPAISWLWSHGPENGSGPRNPAQQDANGGEEHAGYN